MQRQLLILFLCVLGYIAQAQTATIIFIRDHRTFEALDAATILINDHSTPTRSNSGTWTFFFTAGIHHIAVSHIGYIPRKITVSSPFPDTLNIDLEADTQGHDTLETVTILASTRNNQRIENAPLKVEVLGKEEMEEENTIKPANIASILGDISGVQIQQTNVSSGNANVRIQGLDGRYTQMLRDGMPLYDGFSGGLGVLSIPPLDLKQVELIKGSASTLFGSGAIGGTINLISKKPLAKQEAVVTLNRSTLKESNVNTYLAKKYQKFGYTFFGGYTHQTAVDVDGDGFSDVAGSKIAVVHPKLFFYPTAKTMIAAGLTSTWDDQLGGDIERVLQGTHAAPNHSYFQGEKIQRNTMDLDLEHSMVAGQKLLLKGSFSQFHRTTTMQDFSFRGGQQQYFSELSYFYPNGPHALVAGVNFNGSTFHTYHSPEVLLQDFQRQVAAGFFQYTYTLENKTTFEVGLRDEQAKHYGNFLLPRIAFFHRFNEHWGTRAGIGAGYKSPDPFTAQYVDVDIRYIEPIASTVHAENSMGYNLEFNYTKEWNEEKRLFINHAFFMTSIQNPVIAKNHTSPDDPRIYFSNAKGSILSKGIDTYVQLTLDGWELYAGYTYTLAERKYLGPQQWMPLTPKLRMAYTLVKEIEDKWRIGLEGSYNGRQYRLDATQTPTYFFMAAMFERKFGHGISMVLNGENILDVRQTRYESIYAGTLQSPVFKPLWAPIDGRVLNLSLRWKY